MVIASRWWLVVSFVMSACGGEGHHLYLVDGGPDAPIDGLPLDGPCDVLAQNCGTGEKCTWIIDSLMPQYAGHTGCALDGAAAAGEACAFDDPALGGSDNCAKGLVCSNFRSGPGVCKAICDLKGGAPACDAKHACMSYSGLFPTSSAYVSAAGVCDATCDPLGDNDFDGATGPLTRGSGCGSDENAGCYGYPSYGAAPATQWTCAPDPYSGVAPPGFRHRVTAPDYFVNSCNQGYLPLLYESSGSTTIICVAMCKPLDCFAGNCGVNDDNHLGAAPHRCNNTDAMGSFNSAANGDQCQFLWWREVDDTGQFLPSPTSDAVGFCFDVSKYRYDSNGSGGVDDSDQNLPACAQLQDGHGSGTNRADPTTWFGAADLGCVDSTHRLAPVDGKPRPSRGLAALGFRGLYHPTMRAP